VVDDEPYVSSGEAAKRIGVSQSTLANWVQRGWVTPHLRTPGHRYRWQVERLKRELRELGQQHGDE